MLQMSVPSLTVLETHFVFTDLEVSNTVCLVYLEATKPYGHYKRQFFVLLSFSLLF